MGAAYGAGSGRWAGTPAGAPPAAIVARIRAARADPGLVVLEGVHAVKHALRFGGDVEVVVTPDAAALDALLASLAPDVRSRVRALTVTVEPPAWRALTPRELPSPALAVAARPTVVPDAVLAADGPVIVLESPRHLGNVGAAIRVAAAADAGGLLVLGEADPWHPTAVRGAAGLGFALPVARTDAMPATSRPLLALDGDGEPLPADGLPTDAVLLVGTERAGLSAALLAAAERRIRLPMRDGVSSLNLATAVAVALYAGR